MHHRARAATLTAAAALLLSACGTTVATGPPGTGYGTQQGGAQGLGAPGSTGAAPAGGTPFVPGGTGGRAAQGAAVGTSGSALTPPSTAARAPGARAADPLTIGIVLTATSNAAQFGVSIGGSYSEQQIDQAVIDGVNAQGGLAGRKLRVVWAKTDTGSSSWETDFAAACATLTQDNHVAAVLGYVFNYFASFEQCLAKHGIPHLNTGFNIPDREELKPFPLHLAIGTPTIDRRGLLKLDGAFADGVVTAKSKIGVISDTCPGTQTSLSRTFMPEVQRLGLTVTKSISIDCTNGNSDSGRAVSALQSAELQFASSGVDTVVFHSVSEGPALLVFTLDADSQGYHPSYLVSSLANLDALKGYFPSGQAPHIHGYGWLANQDVPPSAYPKPNASQQRCLALLAAKGIKPAVGTDYAYAYQICESVFLYGEALTRTGGDSTGTRVIDALHGLGSSRESVLVNDGSAFGPQRIDSIRADRHVVYRSACSCFAYTGPVRLIPDA